VNNQNSPSAAVALASELRGFAGKLKRRLREQADVGDLTHSQISVLLRLESEGASTTSALARAEGMKSQSMGAVIAALEAMGFVTGAPDPTDRRQTLLSLSDACRRWIAEGRALRQDWLSRMIDAKLSPQEQEQLSAVLPLLHRIVSD